jgi:hypothetical protein
MGVVYFIEAVDGRGLIKVGVSTKPMERLRSLRNSSPVDLRIAALVGGGAHVEHRFHYRYRDFHAWGEWFERHHLIESDIARINARTFDPECLARVDGVFKGDGWWQSRHEAMVAKAVQQELMASVWTPEFGPEWALIAGKDEA